MLTRSACSACALHPNPHSHPPAVRLQLKINYHEASQLLHDRPLCKKRKKGGFASKAMAVISVNILRSPAWSSAAHSECSSQNIFFRWRRCPRFYKCHGHLGCWGFCTPPTLFSRDRKKVLNSFDENQFSASRDVFLSVELDQIVSLASN